MKYTFIRILTLAAASLIAVGADASVSCRDINDGWRFRQGRGEIWYPATVPGTVHTDLMANEIIEDPFFRLNERAVQWVDKEDWMYETILTPTADELSAQNQDLVFYGLDTYADVYLNGSPILNADNMHRTWRVNIKDKLKPGENKLEVYFHSPIKIDLPKCDLYDYGFNTGPDQSQNGGIFDKLVSIFARKAGYHYGWDWGPRLVTSGIWRPVVLETWNGPKIDDVQVIQNEVNGAKADLTLIAEVLSDSDDNAKIEFKADGKSLASKEVALKKGLNRIEVAAQVKKPRLWWPNGLGEPYLYDFTTTVTAAAGSDNNSQEIGLRSIKLHNDKDQYGHNLYFEVNGKPVFMKGVDMVPLDNFLPRITREKYEKHVLDAKNVNMNMIRVWGGGVYEDDYFYQLCDRNGMLVWQDFMFACSTYPADEKFLTSIRHEAVDNVRRLRNHACIALWCGNNECQDVFYGWGNRKKYYEEKGVLPLLESQFKAMYFKTLPEVVKEYGGGTAYRPSSPFAFEDTPSDEGINVALPYSVMGVVVLIVALIFSRVKLPEITDGSSAGDYDAQSTGTVISKLLHNKRFVFGVSALFCYEISEISINSFFINYVTDGGWMTSKTAAVVLSFGGLGLFMAARVTGSWIMSRIAAEKVLCFCAIMTVIASLIVTLDIGLMSRISLFACYAFEAIMFPTIFAISIRGLAGSSTKIASSFLMMSPLGGAVGTLLMGLMADVTSMSTAFLVPCAGYIFVLLYSLTVMPRKLH